LTAKAILSFKNPIGAKLRPPSRLASQQGIHLPAILHSGNILEWNNLTRELGKAPLILKARVGIHPDGALARGTAPDADIPKDVVGAQWYEVPGIWWNTVERLSWTMVGKTIVYGCKFRPVLHNHP